MWLRSANNSSTIILRYSRSRGDSVSTIMFSATLVTQRATMRLLPPTSTRQSRHAPTLLTPSSRQSVGMWMPASSAASRIVCSSRGADELAVDG